MNIDNLEALLHELPALKLEPNRIWRPVRGGKKLDLFQSAPVKESNYTEEWLASDVCVANTNPELKEGISHITLEGEKVYLSDIIKSDPAFFLGSSHHEKFDLQTSMLVKILDCSTRLTLQVHPNRKQAKEVLNLDYGKTEAWYILSCDSEDSYVFMGFKEDITKEKFKALYEQGDITELENALHKVPVKPYELFFIEAGIPHAMGPGIFFLEANEPTDITLRFEKTSPSGAVFDEQGIHAGFGFEKMFDVYDYTPRSQDEIRSKLLRMPITIHSDGGTVQDLLKAEDKMFFGIYHAEIKENISFKQHDAYTIALVLEGEGSLEVDGKKIDIKKADELFIPGGFDSFKISAQSENLEIVFFRPPYAEWDKNTFSL